MRLHKDYTYKAVHEILRASVIALIVDTMDDTSVKTSICSPSCVCKSVSLDVVQRTLEDVFGERWRLYYDAYVEYSSEALYLRNQSKGDTMLQIVDDIESCDNDVEPEEFSSLWGIGYSLPLPCCSESINGLAVQAASNTIESLAKNCSNYKRSFIPGEPSHYDIQNIWICENGRLLWVEYCSWERRKDQSVSDYLNCTGTYIDAQGRKPLMLDGQVVVNNSLRIKALTKMSRHQEKLTKAESDFGHEVWDIAASPQPQCLWSSFWTTGLRSGLETLPGTQAFDVLRFAQNFYEDYLQPTMVPIGINTKITSVDYYDKSWWRFPRQSCEHHRFFAFRSPCCLVDVLQLELMEFNGSTELIEPRLSHTHSYLGATVQDTGGSALDILEEPSYTLVLWRVELPRPLLVWPKGVSGLCGRCDWIVDKDWLFVHCRRHHDTKAYYMKDQRLIPIDITHLVGKIEGPRVHFRVCGINDNILFYDDIDSTKFGFVKFERTSYSKSWNAVPLKLSTRSTNFTKTEADSMDMHTTRYIWSVGRRFIVSTTGELFDFGDVDSSGTEKGTFTPDSDEGPTLQPASYTEGGSVLALTTRSEKTMIVLCPSENEQHSTLSFCLLTPEGRRQLTCYYGERIEPTSVRLIRFCQDARVAIVTPQPQDKRCGGWIVVSSNKLSDMNLKATKYDYHVLKIPELSWRITLKNNSERDVWSKIPICATRDTIILRETLSQKSTIGNNARGWTAYINDLIRFDAHSAVADPVPLGSKIQFKNGEPADNKSESSSATSRNLRP